MDWVSVIPPIVAIGVILWKKEVIVALLVTIFVSELLILLTSGALTLSTMPMGLVGTLERTVGVVGDANNARILAFALMIGVLMSYMQTSGGIAATVHFLINKNIITNQRRAGMVTVILGSLIFVSTYVSSITTGILSRGIFDKFGMSRARLAYMIDSTAAPICLILLFNSFGAYLLALLEGYDLDQTPISILMGTVPYNFYAFIALGLVYYTAYSGKIYGPMRKSEELLIIEDTEAEEEEINSTKSRYMIVPVILLVASVFVVLYWTGNGQITRGSGSKAVLYGVSISSLVAYLMMTYGLNKSHGDLVRDAFKGISAILPLFFIILLSIALGASLKVLGTGPFVASIIGDFLPAYLIVPFFFLAAGVISFATGSSFGAFAILIPMAVPLIELVGIPPSFILAAIIGGGTLGDHSSPISDTSVIASLSAGCDHLEHIKTQLPYTMFGGAIAFLLYLVVSFIQL